MKRNALTILSQFLLAFVSVTSHPWLGGFPGGPIGGPFPFRPFFRGPIGPRPPFIRPRPTRPPPERPFIPPRRPVITRPRIRPVDPPRRPPPPRRIRPRPPPLPVCPPPARIYCRGLDPGEAVLRPHTCYGTTCPRGRRCRVPCVCTCRDPAPRVFVAQLTPPAAPAPMPPRESVPVVQPPTPPISVPQAAPVPIDTGIVPDPVLGSTGNIPDPVVPAPAAPTETIVTETIVEQPAVVAPAPAAATETVVTETIVEPPPPVIAPAAATETVVTETNIMGTHGGGGGAMFVENIAPAAPAVNTIIEETIIEPLGNGPVTASDLAMISGHNIDSFVTQPAAGGGSMSEVVEVVGAGGGVGVAGGAMDMALTEQMAGSGMVGTTGVTGGGETTTTTVTETALMNNGMSNQMDLMADSGLFLPQGGMVGTGGGSSSTTNEFVSNFDMFGGGGQVGGLGTAGTGGTGGTTTTTTEEIFTLGGPGGGTLEGHMIGGGGGTTSSSSHFSSSMTGGDIGMGMGLGMDGTMAGADVDALLASLAGNSSPGGGSSMSFSSSSQGASGLDASNLVNNVVQGTVTATDPMVMRATADTCNAEGRVLWCDPVGVWKDIPGLTTWCLQNCRDQPCDANRCVCNCVDHTTFQTNFDRIAKNTI